MKKLIEYTHLHFYNNSKNHQYNAKEWYLNCNKIINPYCDTEGELYKGKLVKKNHYPWNSRHVGTESAR